MNPSPIEHLAARLDGPAENLANLFYLLAMGRSAGLSWTGMARGLERPPVLARLNDAELGQFLVTFWDEYTARLRWTDRRLASYGAKAVLLNDKFQAIVGNGAEAHVHLDKLARQIRRLVAEAILPEYVS